MVSATTSEPLVRAELKDERKAKEELITDNVQLEAENTVLKELNSTYEQDIIDKDLENELLKDDVKEAEEDTKFFIKAGVITTLVSFVGGFLLGAL